MDGSKSSIISIHALLAESDLNASYGALAGASISIHALLAESDRVYVSYNQYNNTFLSTLSLRRATRTNDRKRDEKVNISIHALLAESDREPTALRTPHHISIHALLAESDLFWTIFLPSCGNFYPRSPCGERPRRTYQQGEKLTFLSTLSLRRATWWG